MKIFTILFLFLLSQTHSALSQSIVLHDNGTPKGFYKKPTFEETVFLKPAGPCKIKKLSIYFSGSTARTDTIRIVGDPAEGAYPPSEFVWSYNSLTEPIVFNYSGTPGWVDIDISSRNLHIGGLDRVGIQHVIGYDGPYFTYDSDGQNYQNSWLCDALTPNPNFYNIQGTIFSLPGGNFMARMEVDYDYPQGNTSAQAPLPSLPDITRLAGLTDANGQPIVSELASIADWNKDGFDDIAIRNRFFQNQGDGTFKEVNLGIDAYATVWADVDNDGYIDCYAMRGMGVDKIYWGKPDGTFEEYTDPNVIIDAPAVTPIWLDYDGDGLLDLFIAYGRIANSDGTETYFPDKLFRNIGNRHFKEVTDEAHISDPEPPPYYDCWAASVCDFNNDNKPDIFVATYRLAPDILHKNNGDGTFTDVAEITGVIGAPTEDPNYFGHGMGSDWADFDNDGWLDLAVGNLGHPDGRGAVSNPSLIFKNGGAPGFKFENVQSKMGLKFFEMNAGILWADLDLDGYQDLWHCQYSYDNISKGMIRNSRVYINMGPDNNYNLQDKTWEFGSLIHGAWSPLRLDFDGDGDVDLLIASSNENVKLFRNDIQRKGNFLSFRMSGNPSEKVCNDGFGSSVMVYSGNKKFMRQLPGSVITARASQATSELNFGLGDITKIDSVIVKYPNGKTNKITSIELNKRYKLPYMQQPVEIKLATPGLVAPANCKTFNTSESSNIDVEWTPVNGATEYHFSAVILPSGDTALTKTLTVNKFTLPGSFSNGMYKWSVKANNTNGASAISSSGIFIINNAAPLPPALSAPMNDSLNIKAKPEFSWSAAAYLCQNCPAPKYEIQISKKSDFSEIAYNVDTISTTKFITNSPLSPATKYYWRVRGINNDQKSTWSSVRSFTTMPLPAVVSLKYPANGATNIKVQPQYEWDALPYTDYYQIQVAEDPGFSIIAAERNNIGGTTTKFLKSLKMNTLYYWKVKGFNDGGEGSWSTISTFTTQANVSVQEQEENGFELFNCSPNPLTNKTDIYFKLDNNCFVTLLVFDNTGNEIAKLVSAQLESGLHQYSWDAGKAVPGSYLIRLEAGKKKATMKIAVVK